MKVRPWMAGVVFFGLTGCSSAPDWTDVLLGDGGSSRDANASRDVGAGTETGWANDASDETVYEPGHDGAFSPPDAASPPWEDSGTLEPSCPGDPTQGWTEYADTFRVQYPYNLTQSDRYSLQGGVYTFWILPTDLPFTPGNTTAPRCEARWSDMTNNQHMWTGDVLFESPGTHTALFQVHQTTSTPGGPGAGPVYLRVDTGDLHELDGQPVVSAIYGKWFNLKVAFDPATASATVWINNCQKLTLTNNRPGIGPYYFKNGVYTCNAPVCRDHYKNIHLYQR
jgi:hypothetical protein